MSLGGIISRGLSLVIAAIYLGFALIGGGGAAVIQLCVLLVWPLAMIWFPEPLGSLSGYIGGGRVNVETPPFLVAFMGWFFLLGLPVVIALLLSSR
jgi:hypothetical protein